MHLRSLLIHRANLHVEQQHSDLRLAGLDHKHLAGIHKLLHNYRHPGDRVRTSVGAYYEDQTAKLPQIGEQKFSCA